MPVTETSATRLADQLFEFNALACKAGDSRVVEAASELELTFSQLRILWTLECQEDELAVSELAGSLSLSTAAAGRALEVLVREGLIDRREDEADRRVKRIQLNGSGREQLDRLREARRASFNEFVESLEPPERQALSEALTPILARRC